MRVWPADRSTMPSTESRRARRVLRDVSIAQDCKTIRREIHHGFDVGVLWRPARTSADRIVLGTHRRHSQFSCGRTLYSPDLVHRGGYAHELAIPGERAIKAGLERELRSPVEYGASALGTQELMTNLVARLVEHLRTQGGLHL